MILTTHAIVGASVAQLFPAHPAVAFAAGFVSHFILDSFPHWDYDLASARRDNDGHVKDLAVNAAFARDLLKIAFDFVIGFVSVYFFLGQVGNESQLLWGAIGGVAPDFLQFVYFKLRVWPLTKLQRFHQYIQRGRKIRSPWWGIATQMLVVAIVLLALR